MPAPSAFAPLTSFPVSPPSQLGGATSGAQRMAPHALELHAKVSGATAEVRLIFYDEGLADWFFHPNPALALNPATDSGRGVLGYLTFGIDRYYHLLRTTGTGTVAATLHPGVA